MSTDINIVTMNCRLTRDAELKYTPSGSAVASVDVANNYSYTSGGEKKESVSYFSLVFWNKPAEIMAEYGKKGVQISVIGRLSQRRWEDAEGNKKNKVEIIVEKFQFIGGKKEGQGSTNNNPVGDPVNLPDDENPFTDNDIPF